MKCCDVGPRRYFLFGMRMFFGVWLLYAGLVKWIAFSPSGFVGFVVKDFQDAKAWPSPGLITALAWLILIAEPVLAIWLLIGKCARCAWATTALLMFLLLVGQSILMKPSVTDNWHYVIMTLVCAALSYPDVVKSENPGSI